MVAYMEHKDLANQVIGPERAVKIGDGVHRVEDLIRQAEGAAGRPEGSVALLAATKTRNVGEIMAAVDAGIRLIGENRPQEVAAKAQGIAVQSARRGVDLGFHLIGQLQANKINKVLHQVDTVESVDNLDLARKIAVRAQAGGLTMGVYLEVNESGEESKSGCDPDSAFDLACTLAGLEGLELDGLMTVGAHVDDESTVRRGFSHLRGLCEAIQNSGQAGTGTCRTLSMGMTDDLAWAVAEGSTQVRVGRAIFGERAFI